MRVRRREGEGSGRDEKKRSGKEGGRFEGQKRKILRWWKAREREGGGGGREKGCVAVKRWGEKGKRELSLHRRMRKSQRGEWKMD